MKWLRAFGCAVEAYLGKEQRYSADRKRDVPLGKKLVDHAAAGIYLGSAYPTPGHVVYFLKARTIRACVHVAFDETSFPGIPDTPLEDGTDLLIPNRDKAAPKSPPAAPRLAPAVDLVGATLFCAATTAGHCASYGPSACYGRWDGYILCARPALALLGTRKR